MAEWDIQPLSRSHDRTAFNSGNHSLDEWLKHRAGQWDRKELSRCYVAVRSGEVGVLGYYALSSHHVTYESLPDDQAKGLPRVDIPVVLLGRLAVDQSVRGSGLGGLLLVDALRRAEYAAELLGIRAVEVDAIDQSARGFYSRFGFISLTDDPNHLFLPMHVIHKLNLSRLKKQ
jgi:predicted GNAT family N-acyltransferase